MFVVIVGDIDRDSIEDKNQVLSLIERLKNTYSDLIIISAACEKGIGKFVIDRCVQDKNNIDVGFVEYQVKPWIRLSAARLAHVYISRNPSLIEVGEEFHIYSSGKKQGYIADLISRLKKTNLPTMVYDFDGNVTIYPEGYKPPKELGQEKGISIRSSDLKSHLE